MTPEQEILQDALAAVGRRIATFAEEIRHHAKTFPLAPEVDLETHSIEMDAFSKRFEVTQDQVVRKLFRSVLAVERGLVVRTRALGDVIDALTELGIISDAAEWHEITKIRNMLAHDYMVTRRDVAVLLNQAWICAPKLIEMFARIETYVTERGLLAEGRPQ